MYSHSMNLSEQALLDDLHSERRGRARGASVWSCVINLASTCTGTGMLALPAAFHAAGLTAGSLLCVAAAACQLLSLHLLERASATCRRRWQAAAVDPFAEAPQVTFFTLAEAALFAGAGKLIDLAILLNCLGGGVISYLIVAADCFSALGLARHVCVLISTLLVAPACYFRSLDSLKVTSAVSVLVLLAIGALILGFCISRGIDWLDPCPDNQHPNGHCGATVTFGANRALPIFCTLPIFVNAFTCQQNFLSVLAELDTPTQARRTRVVLLAPVLPLALYLTVATAGYWTFGHTIRSNVISNYPDTPLTAAVRIALGVVVLCNVPLQLYPSRVSFKTVVGSCAAPPTPSPPSPPTRSRVGTPLPPTPPLSATGASAAAPRSLFLTERLDLWITTVFLALSASVALALTDLGEVVALIGSTGATLLGLITPAASYLALALREDREAPHKTSPPGPWPGPGSSMWRPAASAPLAVRVAGVGLLLLGALVLPSRLFC